MLEVAGQYFFGPQAQWAPEDAWRLTDRALTGMEDGELFLEYREEESLGMEDGVLRQAGFTRSSGFGLRGVSGAETFFAQSDALSRDALERAAHALGQPEARLSSAGKTGPLRQTGLAAREARLYTPLHPLAESRFSDRAALLGEIDAFTRALDPRVVQVNTSLNVQWQVIEIMRPDFLASAGADNVRRPLVDIRPLVRLDITVMVEKDGRRESGHAGAGGRYALARLSQPEAWQCMAREALRQAQVKLEAVPAPAGEMPVVLGAGWPGILLHEAVGHGLEGDFNRKGTSVFSGMIGQRVAAPGVTVVDDGTLPERRGSLHMDDEGTPSGRTVLIEDGILKSYLQDRLNARLTGAAVTGNGRRQSYAHAPLPRMTNTVMMGGQASEEEMIRSTERGIYAVNFGGGQVDITSGKFVFATSEAYLIEGGKITRPVRGATLIGSGRDVMNGIEMIGPEMALDPGIGTCGKAGQGVPVGVGQPMLKVAGLTVGGSAT
ncbi:metalloprotease TldD [Oecophyllibacter saccharovorans]|uniref:metalloprotease TldD n=1 Tax=Oecophyllibacter saccharovorans TaxID=2558360 RepID=UPI001166F926|nr:metalloprotease TldD [Oecophyllibacter saccharovorans]TPW33743.1 metalloprotease TldD [Oecophyllibacter saccharovorans]